jgi:pimeloyl-ACP methyl ester carboxylesterase
LVEDSPERNAVLPGTPGDNQVAKLRRRKVVYFVAATLLVFVLWALLPAARAYTLLRNNRPQSAPNASEADIPVENVTFTASDGVRLAGWLAVSSPGAPTIILVHGFKGSRIDMLPWARFLYAAGYNVLLFDERGCGQSEGWEISLGAREPDDVIGAVHYLEGRADLTDRHYGALGISLGAGVVLLAAAQTLALVAVVADSAWTSEQPQLDRMGSIPIGPVSLPVLAYEPALVNLLIGAPLEDARPLSIISQIAPRAVFLIHSADDRNTTTPLSGERQLYAAAGQPKQQWVAPSGGHAGALAAHTVEYEQRVLAFFARYLR